MSLIFTNEKGNKIFVDVENRDDIEVTIKIEGPTSRSEWVLTYQEASMLRECLIDEGV